MRFLIQRVTQATVHLSELSESRTIAKGLVVYVGIHKEDLSTSPERLEQLVMKLLHLRIFEDSDGKINKGIQEVQGELLLISNFTLRGNTKKGSRIDFGDAAGFIPAKQLYEQLVAQIAKQGVSYQTGEFGAYMEISSTVDGPVNILADR